MMSPRFTRLGGRAWSAIGLLAIGILFIWPVLMMGIGMFWSTSPGLPGEWTLDVVAGVLTDARTYEALWNSVQFATWATLIALALGLTLAFLATKSTMPGHRLITPLMLVILVLPSILYAIAWRMLGVPGAGVLSQLLGTLIGDAASDFTTREWTMMIIVQGVKLASFSYFLLIEPMRAMNASFEEASRMSGASRLQTFVRIMLPLLGPAVLGVVTIGLIFGLSAFDIPQVLGPLNAPPLLATQVYRYLTAELPLQLGAASTLGIFMIAALIVMVVIQNRFYRADRFVTVTGKSYRQDRWDLGWWNAPALALVVFVAIFALILPLSQIVLAAFQSSFGTWQGFTLRNFDAVFRDRQTVSVLWTTFAYAILAGFVAMAVNTYTAYSVRRATRARRAYIDFATMIPLVLPGTILATGIIWAYTSVPILNQLYGTVWLAAIAFVIGVTPVASRLIGPAVLQLGDELEEASRMSGASRAVTIRRVVLPLLARPFITGWLTCAIVLTGVLDLALILLPGRTPNIAVKVYTLMVNTGRPEIAAALLCVYVLVLLAVATTGVLLVRVLNRSLSGIRRSTATPMEQVPVGPVTMANVHTSRLNTQQPEQ